MMVSIKYCVFTLWCITLTLAIEDTYLNCIDETPSPRRCPSELHCRNTITGCFRSFDGTCNNLKKTNWGAIDTPLKRLIDPQYDDGVDTPQGHHSSPNRKEFPTPHQVSKATFTSKFTTSNNKKLSTLFMTFAQFLDHDITLSPEEECHVTECSSAKIRDYPCFPIRFDHRKSDCTEFARGKPVCKTNRHEPRNQLNSLTSFLDLSQVYGTTEKKAKKLRTNDGSGELKVTRRNLLPVDQEKSKCKILGGCRLVGDERGEENIALFSMHILWVRQHNRVAKELKWINPHWNGERIYQTARKICGAMFQHIVYTEFLPHIIYLHERCRGHCTRYNPHQDPSIFNAFSAAAFRFGHSLIPNEFSQLDANFNEVRNAVPLQQAFRNSTEILKFGIGSTMMGLSGNMSDEVNGEFAHTVLNKLFIFPGSKLHGDLTAINIQRGRDHGIPTFGKWREFCGFPKARDFYDLSHTPLKTRKVFKKIYKKVDDIDLFAVGITERHIGSKILGPTFHCIIQRQFKALRDGDRFFYTHRGVFQSNQLKAIMDISLSKILCNNLQEDGIVSLQLDSFKVFDSRTSRRVSCDQIKDTDLTQWRDRPRRRGRRPQTREW